MFPVFGGGKPLFPMENTELSLSGRGVFTCGGDGILEWLGRDGGCLAAQPVGTQRNGQSEWRARAVHGAKPMSLMITNSKSAFWGAVPSPISLRVGGYEQENGGGVVFAGQ